MKTNALCLLVLCMLVNGPMAGKVALAVEPFTLKLWPDGPPTAMGPKSEATVKLIQSYGGAMPNRITDVSDPTITVYRPEKPNGTSVIVAPGAVSCSCRMLTKERTSANGLTHWASQPCC